MTELPEDIARKIHDVSMFFKYEGVTHWSCYGLCSRDFIDAEVATLTKKYKEAFLKEEGLKNRYLMKLKQVWKELDPMFNTEDK